MGAAVAAAPAGAAVLHFSSYDFQMLGQGASVPGAYSRRKWRGCPEAPSASGACLARGRRTECRSGGKCELELLSPFVAAGQVCQLGGIADVLGAQQKVTPARVGGRPGRGGQLVGVVEPLIGWSQNEGGHGQKVRRFEFSLPYLTSVRLSVSAPTNYRRAGAQNPLLNINYITVFTPRFLLVVIHAGNLHWSSSSGPIEDKLLREFHSLQNYAWAPQSRLARPGRP